MSPITMTTRRRSHRVIRENAQTGTSDGDTSTNRSRRILRGLASPSDVTSGLVHAVVTREQPAYHIRMRYHVRATDAETAAKSM